MKALKYWGLPLLGVIPDSDVLASHSMHDFETLFRMPMIRLICLLIKSNSLHDPFYRF